MSGKQGNFFYKIEWSAWLTIIGILILFSSAVIVTLIAPRHIDYTWVQPTSDYQVQMYEVADPNIYFSSHDSELQAVYHLQDGYSLTAFKESKTVRFVAPPHLQKYITFYGDDALKLSSRLILLRNPESALAGNPFDGAKRAEALQKELQASWEREHSDWRDQGLQRPFFHILELFEPEGSEAFAIAPIDRVQESWVDENFIILDEEKKQPWHSSKGVVYINNPHEYRVKYFESGGKEEWRFDPSGESIKNLEELQGNLLGFRSRKNLIQLGEDLYRIEGCWYCHTDQTRTLIQDVVLNGTESYPAPPSSANEYIYERITFLGTRRIGPDLSRVGIKRPSRDWHQSHFWSPKTESKGSIMPAFQHFFDDDPRGTLGRGVSFPNYKFEAIFQYLMTKGTRITPPTEAWWLGKDPVQTMEIIQGQYNKDESVK
ncbi:putative cytochrome oxidase, cytochrome c subunit [Waddlia chondrophila 2032/99]|uniref:Putative cytochrome oxidase, cytochrome c subunit n=2 Tax=Waddlia chondrophila TaxID=71667 RepID=D6YTA2_WADCW|nr:cbb3-type cytochrome c oxidase subunit II [Waddlia chondrophila]ADI39297.1 putative cytochrome oxidase, cytochrome c subunit [Waddlia chondrophila WSU 86-1044]CCB90554.1 putative cytochrome oxidase, cytochrome c subunit [Waddlia chondrophila 2032/99]